LRLTGNLQGCGQALQTVAKKNLLGLKGGLTVDFLEIRLIGTAFLASAFYYHYPRLNSRIFSTPFPGGRVDRGPTRTYM
jgi:hypothetical protein